MDLTEDLEKLAQRAGQCLLAAGRRLVTAESCTGGLIAAACTAIAGSSDWFEAGFVTYRLSAKQRLLGVEPEVLDRYGAVSEPVAHAMVSAALVRSDATVAVSVTGIAGPGGGEVDHPVGTVWFAWGILEDGAPHVVQTSMYPLQGDRARVRRDAVRIALDGVIATVESLAV